jgi:hypothetical protein
VGNFGDDLILGLDFLMKFNCIIDIPGSNISVNQELLPCWIQKHKPGSKGYLVSQILCASPCKVPPLSKVLVPIKVAAPVGTLLVTTPVTTGSLLLPSVFFAVNRDENFIEVVNDTTEQECLSQDTILTEAVEGEICNPTEHTVRQILLSIQ